MPVCAFDIHEQSTNKRVKIFLIILLKLTKVGKILGLKITKMLSLGEFVDKLKSLVLVGNYIDRFQLRSPKNTVHMT